MNLNSERNIHLVASSSIEAMSIVIDSLRCLTNRLSLSMIRLQRTNIHSKVMSRRKEISPEVVKKCCSWQCLAEHVGDTNRSLPGHKRRELLVIKFTGTGSCSLYYLACNHFIHYIQLTRRSIPVKSTCRPKFEVFTETTSTTFNILANNRLLRLLD